MGADRKFGLDRIHATFTEIFGLSRAVSIAAILLITIVVIFAVFWFFHSAPPNTITMTSGPKGSIFETNAERYRQILADNGVTLKILPSQGSLENLKRLLNPSFHVDVGFVQGGVADDLNIEKLVSLGSISFEPLLMFYRGDKPMDPLSQLRGKRLAIGPEGSGTRILASQLLAANGIEAGGATAFLDLSPEAAAKALLEGQVDGVFLMGDVASVQLMRSLLLTPHIHLLNFSQADGYARRFVYLNGLTLPKGSIDFGKDIPAQDVQLIGPTVELIARSHLHPALSDLLLETAGKVHGKAGLFKRRGEFPAPLEHEFPISPDARRFYKSGKSFLYRFLPFRLASLSNRVLVSFGPMVVLLFPILRVLPALYRWRMRLRLYRWYRALLILEEDRTADLAPGNREELLRRLGHIEEEASKMKVPASFGDQFYDLRGHISLVRNRIEASR